MTISPVSSVNNNFRKLSFGENQENKTFGSNIKYLTATNFILGSLATIGVLGMADILICKGKHLNKLTGNNKFIPEIFNAKNFNKAAYDAKLDRTVPEYVLKRANYKNNPLISTVIGNRKLSFKNGKLSSIMHYDPETNVSKLERFATQDLQSILTKKDGTDVLGKVYKEGDIFSEQYFLGDQTGYQIPFLRIGEEIPEGYFSIGYRYINPSK